MTRSFPVNSSHKWLILPLTPSIFIELLEKTLVHSRSTPVQSFTKIIVLKSWIVFKNGYSFRIYIAVASGFFRGCKNLSRHGGKSSHLLRGSCIKLLNSYEFFLRRGRGIIKWYTAPSPKKIRGRNVLLNPSPNWCHGTIKFLFFFVRESSWKGRQVLTCTDLDN